MKKFLKSKLFRYTTLLVLIGSIIFILLPKKAQTKVDVTYETEKAFVQDIALSVSVTGVVVPTNRKNVVTISQAEVKKINVSIGDTVKTGYKLAQLDDYKLQNNLKKARYGYYAAIYARNQAKEATIQDDNRVHQLQQQVNSAYVDVQAAENALKNDIYIKSPISGVISAINVSIGNTPPATTPSFIIQSKDSYLIKLVVNQADISKIEIGQEVSLEFSSKKESRKGKVTKIYPSAIIDPSGIVNYYVETSIEDTEGILADMTVDANIMITKSEDALTVPSAALSFSDGKYFVHIVHDKDQSTPIMDSDIEKIAVTVGINNNTIAEILSGIKENDTVIVSTNSSDKNETSTGFMPQRPERTEL